MLVPWSLPVGCRGVVISVSVTSFVVGVNEEVDTSELVAMSVVTSVVVSGLSVGFVYELVISSVVEDGEDVVVLESVTMSVASVGFKVVMPELVTSSVLGEVVTSESVTTSVIKN